MTENDKEKLLDRLEKQMTKGQVLVAIDDATSLRDAINLLFDLYDDDEMQEFIE